MNPPTLELVTALLLSTAILLPSCKKKDDPAAPPSATASPVGSVAAPASDGADVAFKGTYKKFAEDTMKDGKHRHSSDVTGASTITIDKGVVTWVQDYQSRGTPAHVSQVYRFSADSVKPRASGGFDVALTWQSMDANTKSYNPDKNNAKLVAQKNAAGWLISLMTTDDKGVIAGVEFR